jgi:ABC-type Fe3+-siderophore transport system permease subunit
VRRATTPVVIGTGLVVALLVALASLTVGVAGVPLTDVLRALGDLVTGGGEPSTTRTLIVDMRLPRAVGALCAGAALGTAGCMLQALLRNPLASPFVIGTSQAAAFGAVLAICLEMTYLGILGVAFVTALCGGMLVVALARTQRGLPTDSVVLTGLSISLLFGALTGLVRALNRDEGQTDRMSLWMLGGLWQITWKPLLVLAPLTVVAVAASLLLSRRLDLLALGESDAQRLGVRVDRTGTLVLAASCLLTALAVCVAGIVAFVGLIVPHAARKVLGPSHAALLPASAFLGGAFVVVTDCVARSVAPPQELPLAVITSLVGVPAFLLIMRSMRARRSAA